MNSLEEQPLRKELPPQDYKMQKFSANVRNQKNKYKDTSALSIIIATTSRDYLKNYSDSMSC